MAFNLEGMAQDQARNERKERLLKEYRAARSLKIQGEKEAETARKKVEGAERTMAKLIKEAEDELGEEWHSPKGDINQTKEVTE